MTVTFYPDISNYQAGISLAGAPAVCCKATEGTTYVSPDYARAKADAASHGAYFFAYHFLHAGGASAQADHCHSVTGGLPVMIDAETTGSSNPTVSDIATFCDRYRALGGKCELVYLPHWYWQRIGSPSLSPLALRGLKLVSSAYPSGGYTGVTGTGWQPYGGMTPSIWQFSASYYFNGQHVDFNAFQGTVAQLRTLAEGTPAPPPPPVPVPVPPVSLQEDDMQLTDMAFVPFKSGQFSQLYLYRDFVTSKTPAKVRVAVHYPNGHYSISTVTLDHPVPVVHAFPHAGADAVSLLLESGPSPVGYVLA